MTFEQWCDTCGTKRVGNNVTGEGVCALCAGRDLDTPEQQAFRDGYAQGKADAEKEHVCDIPSCNAVVDIANPKCPTCSEAYDLGYVASVAHAAKQRALLT